MKVKKKKESANWYIAATHYLTSGFVIPLIINAIAAFTILPLLGEGLMSYVVLLVIYLASIWLGVMYSANYLKKAYIIKEPAAIVKLSVIYMVVLFLIFFGFTVAGGEVPALNLGLEGLRLILVAILFFVASKKYIKVSLDNTQAQVPPMNQPQ